MQKIFLLFLIIAQSFVCKTVSSQAGPHLLWGKSFPNIYANDNVFVYGFTADKTNSNRLYVSGLTNGRTLVGDYVVNNGFLAQYDTSGHCNWAVETVGGDIDVDNNGNIFIGSTFAGTKKVGNNTVTANNWDALLMKYDSQGNLLWYRQTSGAGEERIYKVGVDAGGQVYAIGSFNAAATIGGVALSPTHRLDDFLMAYDNAGNPLWAKAIAGCNSTLFNSPSLAVSGNDVFATNVFTGTVPFGPAILTSVDSSNIYLAKYNNTGTCLWARQVKNGLQNQSRIVTDIAGNVYLAGQFTYNIELETFTLNNYNANQTHLDLFLAKYDGAGNCAWAKNVGFGAYYNDFFSSLSISPQGVLYCTGEVSAPTTIFAPLTYSEPYGSFYARYNSATGECFDIKNISDQQPKYLAFDNAGKTYMAGTNPGYVLFTTGADSNTIATGLAPDDTYQYGIYVTKLDTALTRYYWGQSISGGPPAVDFIGSIAVDNSQNIISAGSYGHSIITGQDTTRFYKTLNTAIIIKSNTSGQVQWVRHFGGTSSSVNSTVTDAAGNIYVAGSFSGSDSVGSTVVNSAGKTDVFVAKFNAAGDNVWIKVFGGTTEEQAIKLVKDAGGNIIVTGYFTGTATIGNTTFTAAGFRDIFIIKLDTDGNYIWQKTFGSTGNDEGLAVAVDNSNNIFLTGRFSNTVNFGSTALTCTGNSDIYLTKIDVTGNVLWAKKYGGTGYNTSTAVIADGNGGVYMGGYYRGNIAFGCASFTGSESTERGFIARLDADGTCQWVDSLDGDGSTIGAVSLSPTGNLFVTGSFTQSLGFDTLHLVSTGTYGNAFMAAYTGNGAFIWAKQLGGGSEDIIAAAAIDATVPGILYVGGYFGNVLGTLFGYTGNLYLEPGNASGNLAAPVSNDGFVAAYTDGVVPLKLLSFTAVKKEQSVQLLWSTANEINFSHFDIERSTNGTNFTAIGKVYGYGSENTNNYSTWDNAPLNGFNYYRLKMKDTDGRFTYSNVATVLFDKKNTITVLPNPVINRVTVTGIDGIMAARIIDMSGKTLLSFTSIQNNTINLQGLAKGFYVLELISKNNVSTIVKIVKE